MMETAIIVGLIFLLLILRNLWILHLSRPVDLLHSGNVGETEPRSRKLMALIGLVALLTGYVMAVTIQNPITALSTFFIAVILVIIGTYCLFTAVSVVVLKALRKNKRFYYQPRHFTAVSGLLYRMKQNAKGMHNICILMTMLLVTISTTVCLYAGSESSLNAMYPDKLSMTAHLEPEELNKPYCEELRESFLRWAGENDLPTDTFKDRLLLEFSVLRTGGRLHHGSKRLKSLRYQHRNQSLSVQLHDAGGLQPPDRRGHDAGQGRGLLLRQHGDCAGRYASAGQQSLAHSRNAAVHDPERGTRRSGDAERGHYSGDRAGRGFAAGAVRPAITSLRQCGQ